MKLIYATCLTLAVTCTFATASTLLSYDDANELRFTSAIDDSNTGTSVRTVSASASASGVSRPALSIKKFDPTLGMLNSITVNWEMRNYEIPQLGRLTCRDSGANSSCERESFSREITQNTAMDLPGVGTRVIVDTFLFEDTYDVAPIDFDLFTGTGNLLIPWRIGYSHSLSGSCDPNLLTIITQCYAESEYILRFSAGIEVIYDYDVPGPTPAPVPLPASGLLLLGALATFRLRRG